MFFLIYINDLWDDLTSNLKLFVHDTSLFSVVQSINSTTITDLNIDLCKINGWSFQRKMSFNPHPNKQAQKLIFSRKMNEIDHPPLLFNQNLFISYFTLKYLRMVLDTKLDFNFHLKMYKAR